MNILSGIAAAGRFVKQQATAVVKTVASGARQHVDEEVRHVGDNIARQADTTLADVARRVSDNPTVNKALDKLGNRAAAPINKQLTPKIVIAVVVVVIAAAVLIYASRRIK